MVSRATGSINSLPAASSPKPATSSSAARPASAKATSPKPFGRETIRHRHTVYYRSIFDLVRDLAASEGGPAESRLLARYLKPDLLIIDDMGLKTLPARSGELLLEIILRRHEVRSTIMTSNRPVDEWGKLLGDVPAAGAILDRLLHRAEVIALHGRNHRLAAGPAGKAEERSGKAAGSADKRPHAEDQPE